MSAQNNNQINSCELVMKLVMEGKLPAVHAAISIINYFPEELDKELLMRANKN